jgi:hypothetical protein
MIKESKRFLLIMSKNVTTDPTCIWACEVAVEEAIGGQNLKQLISIYPRDKKQVCARFLRRQIKFKFGNE